MTGIVAICVYGLAVITGYCIGRSHENEEHAAERTRLRMNLSQSLSREQRTYAALCRQRGVCEIPAGALGDLFLELLLVFGYSI